MKRVQFRLNQKDSELLQKFEIHKEVQVKLLKLQLNVNTQPAQNNPLIFSSMDASNKEIKLFKCHICPYLSRNKYTVIQHSWTHSAHKRFKCDKCSYRANTKRSLQHHISSKHNKNLDTRTRNHPCQFCSKCFFTMTAMRRHLTVHTREKPFLCQFCSDRFTSNSYKNHHEIICTQNPKGSDPTWVESQKQFQCNLCNKRLFTSGALITHIRGHTREKPYTCDKCDYVGAAATNLTRHQKRRHNPNKIRNFACEHCLEMFFTKEDLYQHIQTHTKEKSSECEFCKRQFLKESNRNRHQIMCKLNPKLSDDEWVRNQKKFKCELCVYSSTQKITLQGHLTKYTGETPFKCLFCQFKATSRSCLYRHLNTHTKEKPNKCPHCEFRANRNSQISDHVKRQHK